MPDRFAPVLMRSCALNGVSRTGLLCSSPGAPCGPMVYERQPEPDIRPRCNQESFSCLLYRMERSCCLMIFRCALFSARSTESRFQDVSLYVFERALGLQGFQGSFAVEGTRK